MQKTCDLAKWARRPDQNPCVQYVGFVTFSSYFDSLVVDLLPGIGCLLLRTWSKRNYETIDTKTQDTCACNSNCDPHSDLMFKKSCTSISHVQTKVCRLLPWVHAQCTEVPLANKNGETSSNYGHTHTHTHKHHPNDMAVIVKGFTQTAQMPPEAYVAM